MIFETRILSLFKEARKTMDIGARLDIQFKEGRNFMLKKFVEMEEAELAEKINALDDFEENGD